MCVQYIAGAYGLSFDTHKPAHLCRLTQCIRTLPLTPSRTTPLTGPPPTSTPRHLLLALPTTYMNRSGNAFLALLTAYHIPPPHSILIYDDIHLPIGTLRIATRGGDGGHNGLGDVLQRLREAGRGGGVVRVRVGVGAVRDDGESGGSGGLVGYVLGEFGREEMGVLEGEVFAKVKRVVEGIAAGEVDRMMNQYNGKACRNADDTSNKSEARQTTERLTTADESVESGAVT